MKKNLKSIIATSFILLGTSVPLLSTNNCSSTSEEINPAPIPNVSEPILNIEECPRPGPTTIIVISKNTNDSPEEIVDAGSTVSDLDAGTPPLPIPDAGNTLPDSGTIPTACICPMPEYATCNSAMQNPLRNLSRLNDENYNRFNKMFICYYPPSNLPTNQFLEYGALAMSYDYLLNPDVNTDIWKKCGDLFKDCLAN